MGNGCPFALPLDAGTERARASAYHHRAACARLRAFVDGHGSTPEGVARTMFPDDRVTETVLKAATAPAMTSVSGWAKELAGVAVIDLVQSITSLSAGA